MEEKIELNTDNIVSWIIILTIAQACTICLLGWNSAWEFVGEVLC